MAQDTAGRTAGWNYQNARDTVTALHDAGVAILVGTDAHSTPGAPAALTPGQSIHREFELLTKAGLTPVEVLESATILTAEFFGLTDRGAIEPGKRADLLLINGDPTRPRHHRHPQHCRCLDRWPTPAPPRTDVLTANDTQGLAYEHHIIEVVDTVSAVRPRTAAGTTVNGVSMATGAPQPPVQQTPRPALLLSDIGTALQPMPALTTGR